MINKCGVGIDKLKDTHYDVIYMFQKMADDSYSTNLMQFYYRYSEIWAIPSVMELRMFANGSRRLNSMYPTN